MLIFGFQNEQSASAFLRIFGFVSLIVGILGFIFIPHGGYLLGFIDTNLAGHWLHIVLGAVILGIGVIKK